MINNYLKYGVLVVGAWVLMGLLNSYLPLSDQIRLGALMTGIFKIVLAIASTVVSRSLLMLMDDWLKDTEFQKRIDSWEAYAAIYYTGRLASIIIANAIVIASV